MIRYESAAPMHPLPSFLKPLFWSFCFDTMDTLKNKKTIIIQTVNYGSWKHWKWLSEYYGKQEIAKAIRTIPVSEFRKGAFALARIVFNVENHDYAYRSTRTRGETTVSSS